MLMRQPVPGRVSTETEDVISQVVTDVGGGLFLFQRLNKGRAVMIRTNDGRVEACVRGYGDGIHWEIYGRADSQPITGHGPPASATGELLCEMFSLRRCALLRARIDEQAA